MAVPPTLAPSPPPSPPHTERVGEKEKTPGTLTQGAACGSRRWLCPGLHSDAPTGLSEEAAALCRCSSQETSNIEGSPTQGTLDPRGRDSGLVVPRPIENRNSSLENIFLISWLPKPACPR